MTILESDIKLKKSERLTDTDDGGGYMTGNVVVDGEVNNLLPDISRFDRTAGRVNLRKFFGHVDTNNVDILYGTHLILLRPPVDPRVHLSLFSTGSDQDERSNAKNFIESYVVQGPASEMRLWDTQQAGQRVLLLYKNRGTPDPEIGEVYCLSIEASGLTPFQQYVRVLSWEKEERVFNVGTSSERTREIVTMEISVPLEQQFPGEDAASTASLITARTKVRNTQVADAAEYYGVSRVIETPTIGDRTLVLDSVYTQIVPNTTSEEPVVNQPPAATAQTYSSAGDPITVTGSVPASTSSIYVGNPILPGSVSITLEGTALIDVDGVLTYEGSPGAWTGSVNYDGGQITLARSSGSSSYAYSLTFRPAGFALLSPFSFLTPIELANRRQNYTYKLVPTPAPASVRISFRALGKWYTVRDDAQGGMVGVLPNTGSGTINYTTGDVIVTFSALPDVGSSVLVSWSDEQTINMPLDPVDILPPYKRIDLGVAIDPDSVVITWTNSGAKTANGDSSGVISGDAAGVIDANRGIIEFRPTSLPGPTTVYSVAYDERTQQSQSFTVPSAGALSVTLSATPVVAGSVVLTGLFNTSGAPDGAVATLKDDGAGHLLWDGYEMAAINYSTGEITSTVPGVVYNDALRRIYELSPYVSSSGLGAEGGSWSGTYATAAPLQPTVSVDEEASWLGWKTGASILVKYLQTGYPSGSDSADVEQGALVIDLTPGVAEPIIPGSVRFTFNSKTYFDRSGALYTDLDATTGAAADAGTINYGTGEILLEAYNAGTPSFTMRSIATSPDRAPVGQYFFRTAAAPIGVGSLIVTATAVDGTAISAIANNDGELIDTYLQGKVDAQTGIVDLRFGQQINQDNGSGVEPTWVFKPVDPSTIRYNAVLVSYLPLSPEVLGLNPTRLPADGRVPIFRPGRVAVIHHTDTEALATPVAGATIELNRNPVSKLRLLDAEGTELAGEHYAADLDAGEFTWADPLDLSDYTGPFTAEHRIEDMRLISDVQINGEITFTNGVAFAFPADEALVSSALHYGDLGARVEHLFTQKTWTNVWSNSRIGDDSIAKYNDIVYPLVVANRGAITERWAIIFTSTTAYQVLGETSGIIATGTTATDLAPTNPMQGVPYFTILASGWGGGWVSNNVLRFNTVAAAKPAWLARTTESGTATVQQDDGRVELRGDAD